MKEMEARHINRLQLNVVEQKIKLFELALKDNSFTDMLAVYGAGEKKDRTSGDHVDLENESCQHCGLIIEYPFDDETQETRIKHGKPKVF